MESVGGQPFSFLSIQQVFIWFQVKALSEPLKEKELILSHP